MWSYKTKGSIRKCDIPFKDQIVSICNCWLSESEILSKWAIKEGGFLGHPIHSGEIMLMQCTKFNFYDPLISYFKYNIKLHYFLRNDNNSLTHCLYMYGEYFCQLYSKKWHYAWKWNRIAKTKSVWQLSCHYLF